MKDFQQCDYLDITTDFTQPLSGRNSKVPL